MSENGCCWPEQEAVWAWMQEHGIGLSHAVEDDLKRRVSEYRIQRDKKVEQLECDLLTAYCQYEEWTKERSALERSNKELREALEYYAEHDRGYIDNGDKARAALSATDAKGEKA